METELIKMGVSALIGGVVSGVTIITSMRISIAVIKRDIEYITAELHDLRARV